MPGLVSKNRSVVDDEGEEKQQLSSDSTVGKWFGHQNSPDSKFWEDLNLQLEGRKD